MNVIHENIPVNLSYQLRLKECIHNFFRKPTIVRWMTYFPAFLCTKVKHLALLITRVHEVFSDTKTHSLPRITVYGGDRLTTLNKWENAIKKPKTLLNTLIFTDADSLSAARENRLKLTEKTEKIAIINFANRWQKGGIAYAPYGGSQEEYLARRSNMARKENYEEVHRQLTQIRKNEGYKFDEKFYHHIPYFGAVVAANVTFIADKDSVTEPTKFDQFDTIWTAAVDNRKNSDEYLHLHANFQKQEDTVRYNIMHNKLKAVFNAAISENDQHVILGAFGCGCFKNDDTKVAAIIKDLLHNDYKGCFKSITISITDKNKLEIFKNILTS